MKTKNLVLMILMATWVMIGSIKNGFAENVRPGDINKKATLSGKVVDKNSGESLAGALVVIKGTDLKVYTDLEGNYMIKDITPGSYTVEVSFISYPTFVKDNIDCKPKVEKSLDLEIQSY